MPTLPLLPLAPTMLTMELTLVDMELSAGTLITQSCWLDTKQPIIEKNLLKKMCQNLPTQWLVATEKKSCPLARLICAVIFTEPNENTNFTL